MESGLVDYKTNFELFNNSNTGFISKKDVLVLLNLLGFNIQDKILKKIIQKKSKITYDKFLSIILEYKSKNCNYNKIIKAFNSIVDNNNNNNKLIDINYFINLLTTKGDILSNDDIKLLCCNIEIINNKFKYDDFVELISNL